MIKEIRRGFLLTMHALLLTVFIGCSTAQKSVAPLSSVASLQSGINVGFDVDDTLLFSSPAFNIANKSEYSEYSEEWWAIVNKSDEGNSIVKKVAEKILNEHKAKGDGIFAITARDNAGSNVLKGYLNKTFGIKKENVFCTNRKAEKIRELNIKIFYGDSDSDITAAQEAGAKGIRILRSSKSSYKGKYHPGEFGEEIIPNSEE
ncbi:MAG: HAD family acid phosphatase [Elusimicrobiota bacterium]|nr:HAD family acid phosphatase [Elusimicrobiota bacterium]